MHKATCLIADSRCWRPGLDLSVAEKVGLNCQLITDQNQLTIQFLEELNPAYIFFPHWSEIIKPEVYKHYECVIFHMTDLPFGRGGSPLQNLISRGIYETQISALRCVQQLDAGPIYLKRPLSLYGTAREIYMRANAIIEEMIVSIIQNKPIPKGQVGEPVIFKRRKEADSDISGLDNLQKVHDFIRMLDAEGYPRAFIETENLRFEFNRSSLFSDHIFADVIIRRKQNGK